MQAQNLTFQNGVLKFSSISVYEQYAENTLDRNDILNTTSGINMLSKFLSSSDTLYPEFLGQILNADKIMGIGNFLIKIDLENNRALAVKTNVTDAYNLLVNNSINSSDVMNFSTEVDNAPEILESIDNGTLSINDYQSQIVASRRCSGARRVTNKGIDFWKVEKNNPNSDCPDHSRIYALDDKLVYQKFIFYFSIQAKTRSTKGCSSSNWNLTPLVSEFLELHGTIKYKKVSSCSVENNLTKDITDYTTILNWRPYEGMRALNAYDCNVTFVVHEFDRQPGSYPSFQYHISAGY